MRESNKNCQNCNVIFEIEPEDVEFYSRLEVPPPTFCPECRLIRRLQFRNERTLYHGACALTGKKVITMFRPDAGCIVYDRDLWWSDSWDAKEYAIDYDFSKPFFSQFRKLLTSVPLPNLASSSNIESPYVNHSQECKSSYLVFASHDTENVMYSTGVLSVRDSLDLYAASSATECYEDVFVTNVNRVTHSYGTEESINSSFLRDCKNMSDCLGCVNMRNGRYCIFNKAYSKDEYERKRGEVDFGSYRQTQEFVDRFNMFSKSFPRRYASLTKCVDVTGDNCISSKSCHACFDLYGDVQNGKYNIHGLQLRDGYDVYGFGVNAELLYEGVDVGINASRCLFAVLTHGSQLTEYTYHCYNSSNLFGCVGLRSANYCILNKQYSRADYEVLRRKIIEQMEAVPYIDSRGARYRYGEFFPSEISLFAYNESIAQEYFPLDALHATAHGYRWFGGTERSHAVTLKSADIPDHIVDVPQTICGAVIACEHNGLCLHQCSSAFKITPQELEFYQKHRLALPRLCSNCRHYARLQKRTPYRLWNRACQCNSGSVGDFAYENTTSHAHDKLPCPALFFTAQPPERNESVYCELCYQKEVV